MPAFRLCLFISTIMLVACIDNGGSNSSDPNIGAIDVNDTIDRNLDNDSIQSSIILLESVSSYKKTETVLTWKKFDGVKNYIVYYSQDDLESDLSTAQQIVTPDLDIIITDLNPGVKYFFRVGDGIDGSKLSETRSVITSTKELILSNDFADNFVGSFDYNFTPTDTPFTFLYKGDKMFESNFVVGSNITITKEGSEGNHPFRIDEILSDSSGANRYTLSPVPIADIFRSISLNISNATSSSNSNINPLGYRQTQALVPERLETIKGTFKAEATKRQVAENITYTGHITATAVMNLGMDIEEGELTSLLLKGKLTTNSAHNFLITRGADKVSESWSMGDRKIELGAEPASNAMGFEKLRGIRILPKPEKIVTFLVPIPIARFFPDFLAKPLSFEIDFWVDPAITGSVSLEIEPKLDVTFTTRNKKNFGFYLDKNRELAPIYESEKGITHDLAVRGGGKGEASLGFAVPIEMRMLGGIRVVTGPAFEAVISVGMLESTLSLIRDGNNDLENSDIESSKMMAPTEVKVDLTANLLARLEFGMESAKFSIPFEGVSKFEVGKLALFDTPKISTKFDKKYMQPYGEGFKIDNTVTPFKGALFDITANASEGIWVPNGDTSNVKKLSEWYFGEFEEGYQVLKTTPFGIPFISKFGAVKKYCTKEMANVIGVIEIIEGSGYCDFVVESNNFTAFEVNTPQPLPSFATTSFRLSIPEEGAAYVDGPFTIKTKQDKLYSKGIFKKDILHGQYLQYFEGSHNSDIPKYQVLYVDGKKSGFELTYKKKINTELTASNTYLFSESEYPSGIVKVYGENSTVLLSGRTKINPTNGKSVLIGEWYIHNEQTGNIKSKTLYSENGDHTAQENFDNSEEASSEISYESADPVEIDSINPEFLLSGLPVVEEPGVWTERKYFKLTDGRIILMSKVSYKNKELHGSFQIRARTAENVVTCSGEYDNDMKTFDYFSNQTERRYTNATYVDAKGDYFAGVNTEYEYEYVPNTGYSNLDGYIIKESLTGYIQLEEDKVLNDRVCKFHKDFAEFNSSHYRNGNKQKEVYVSNLAKTKKVEYYDPEGNMVSELNLNSSNNLEGVKMNYTSYNNKFTLEKLAGTFSYHEQPITATYKRYSHDGVLLEDKSYLDYKLHGTVKLFYRTGEPLKQYQADASGIHSIWASDGTLIKESVWVTDELRNYKEYTYAGILIKSGAVITGRNPSSFSFVRIGAWKEYFSDDGALRVDASYDDNGRKHGDSISYLRNGEVSSSMPYVAGQRHGTYIKYGCGKVDPCEISREEYVNNMRHGMSTTTRSNGIITDSVNYIDGSKSGDEIRRSDDGVLSYKGSYSQGKKIGIHTWYFSNSSIRKTGEYQNNLKTGRHTSYWGCCGLHTSGVFIDGLEDGEHIETEQYGRRWVRNFSLGVLHGDYLESSYREQVLKSVKYINGVGDGPFRRYYTDDHYDKRDPDSNDDNLYKSYNLILGRIDGLFSKFHPNGNPWESVSYTEGKRHGVYSNYYYHSDPNVLDHRGSYRDGVKVGTWHYYDSDGNKKKTEVHPD